MRAPQTCLGGIRPVFPICLELPQEAPCLPIPNARGFVRGGCGCLYACQSECPDNGLAELTEDLSGTTVMLSAVAIRVVR
jgi:hypothetical protein